MKKIITLVINLFIVIMTVLLIVLPKIEFSSNENRYLQKWPFFKISNILSGKYMTELTNYISDHFPLREELLNLKTNIYKTIGINYQNNIYYADDYLIDEYKRPENNEKIVRVVNRFIDNNPGINYDFMLVPTSSYIMSYKLPKYNLNYNQEDTINYFKDNIKGNFIDVSKTLLENNDKYIYYKTDHHWTTKGASLAYLEYCKIKGFTPKNYEFKKVSNDFYGTTYSKVIDNSISADSIEQIIDNDNYVVNYNGTISNSLYNEKYLSEKDKYSYFLNGNQALITITNYNPSSSDKEILIIKDSYANSFVPFIVNHYHKIHVIDPRYYKNKISDYIKNNNINNILFLYNIGTLDEDLGILSIN